MSAFFENNGQYLQSDLGAEAPVPDDFKCITYWQRWDSGETPNSLNFALNLSSAEVAFMHGGVDNSHAPAIEARGDGGPTATGQAGVPNGYAADTWYLVALYCNADDGATDAVFIMEDISTQAGGATRTWANDTTTDWDDLEIGRSVLATSTEDWKGWVADVAIWNPANLNDAKDIIDALNNSGDYLRADEISGTDTPVWYATLKDDATVTTGASLTNNGTVTFDDSIEPPFFVEATAGAAAMMIGL